MNKQQLEELKKILYSKIDQISVLIWDNFKTVNYDHFVINKKNLDEQISKIRKIINNSENNLEVLVMQKDVLHLTKEFMEKDIFKELENEKKKLRTTRFIYLWLMFLFVIVWVVIYWYYFLNFLTQNIREKCNYNNISQNNNIKNSINNNTNANNTNTKNTNTNNTNNSINSSNNSNNTIQNSSKNSQKLNTNKNLDSNKNNQNTNKLENTNQNTNSKSTKEETKSIKWNFIIWFLEKKRLLWKDKILWKIKIIRTESDKNYTFDKKVENFDIKKTKFIIIKYEQDISFINKNKKIYGIFKIEWIKWNKIIVSIIKAKFKN